jgi:peptidoglycan-associated lipoprotein
MISASGLLLQGCKSSIETADKNLYELHQYAVAADMYKKVYKEKKTTKEDKIKCAYNIGESYRLNHDSREALKWYSNAIRAGMKTPEVLYRKAEMLMKEGQYTEAIVEFQKYQKMTPNDTRSVGMIKGCEIALTCKDKKSRYIIESFKVTNDSKSDDFSPVWADKKHSSIMFTSDRPEGVSKDQHKWTGRAFHDVWIVERKGRKGSERWGPPSLVEGLNAKYSDGTVTFDAKYSVMYFTSCNSYKEKGLGKDSLCRIYEARRRGKAWDVSPEPLPFCGPSATYDCANPALSPDGKKLYFVSDMPGSYQDPLLNPLERTQDIYVVNYASRGKTWGPPINLGPTVNTTGNERFPFVNSDGTLYFASDGHAGLGGLDIFFTTGTGEEWAVPTNMGCPVNSKGDDFGIILDETKEYGFFSSDRAKGNDDIYEFSMTPMVCILKGTVTDCDKKSPLENALVVISNDKDTSKMMVYTDRRGFYEVQLNCSGVNYEINVSKREDYFYDSKPKYVSTIGVEQSAEYIKDFCLKNQCDDIFVLPIYYGLDSADLRPESIRILDELVETLNKYPKMKVELGTHTDCRETFEYNRALSQRRADSAVAHIILRGVNPFRLEARGFGESQLTNKCECEGTKIVPCTEAEHQENRRATVQVINCNYEYKTPNTPDSMNEAALNPIGGPIYSPFLMMKRKEYILANKDSIDKIVQEIEKEDKKKRDELERIKMAEAFDIINLTKQKDKYLIDAMVDKKKIKFYYDPEALRTEIPQNVVEQLLGAGSISADDFAPGKEKIKFSDGTKVTSRNFKIKTLKIGDNTFDNVRCKMGDDDQKPTLSPSMFSDYESVEIKDNMLLLKKKKN